ncbi:hypothetical protein BG28_00520 [Nesterenkonia sp. AN1]|uniref:Uncharacterized protein n=1 Tax=Nesterenkonia aurantiaca TaxID=1436010 RepID=A0A4R7G2E7_9MICC|nr:hypothetical protein [Nesterenkonia]EXF26294.1 hypothetical protein BG28_00520 [Nesterenkonia sp. AN1]TDS85435.1 hypothetical protein EV640_10682 [Nesterenkonia aurantiaca]
MLPWFAWIAIIAIVVFGVTQIVSMATGRPLPWGSDAEEEIEALRKRLKKLEKENKGELEAPKIPTKSEDNMSAEDRWRLDMLEARLEELEQRRRDDRDKQDDGGSAGA